MIGKYEHTIADPHEYVSILYLQFTFDLHGALQTDLYVKPTDSRSYLQYGNAHPNHVFSAVVFSQCVWLIRIINCNLRLENRLNELKDTFLNSNYPVSMVDKIIAKVLSIERCLKKPQNRSNSYIIVPLTTPPKTIRIISTHGGDRIKKNCFRTKKIVLFRTIHQYKSE